MKILFITRGFPTEKNPMMGNYESVQAKALAKQGHDVICMSIYKKSFLHVANGKKVASRIVDGVKVYEMDAIIPYIPHLPHLYRLENYYLRKACDYLYNEVVKKHGTPDIIHCHCLYVLCHCSFIKEKYKVPIVHTEHWSAVDADTIDRTTRLMARSYKDADQIICVSKSLADSLMSRFGLRSIVVNNMVEDHFFSKSSSYLKKTGFRFISVGRLVYNKHFDLLIRCFAEARFGKNVSLDIVGMGEEYEFLQNTIRKYNVEDQVHLVGLQPPSVVAEMLASSDCFVLTSRLETFGIVIIEALAKGVPVISVPCGGPEEIIIPQIGILTEDDSPKNITNALVDMVNNKEKYDSDYIREYCYSKYSQESISKQIESVYVNTIKKNK